MIIVIVCNGKKQTFFLILLLEMSIYIVSIISKDLNVGSM